MAEEGKGVALAILGIVAVIAVVGLVLLFTGATGKFVEPGLPKVYTRQSENMAAYGAGNPENPYGDYNYETNDYRYGAGKVIQAGGAWDPSNVHGDGTAPGASQDRSIGAAPESSFSPDPSTYLGNPNGYGSGPVILPNHRIPDYIPTKGSASDVCSIPCPNYATCIADSRRVPSGAQPMDGYPGCYVA